MEDFLKDTAKTLGLEPLAIRKFETGATRDTDENKLKYTGFLSQPVLRRYAEYMHEHRKQSDGTLRDPDNWKKGIPLEVYHDSGFRHEMEWWELFERTKDCASEAEFDIVCGLIEDVLCAKLFNVMGALHEVLKLRK